MDRAEFERRALPHLDAVWRMALQLARNEPDAGDLVQETWLRAWRASGRFEDRPGGMRAWLFRILHNVFFSELERGQRRPASIDPSFDQATDAATPDADGTVWSLADLDWERVDGRIRDAIGRLSPEHREILLLWAVEGLKYREIAGILDVPIGTIMSRLHRARANLVKDLADLAEERRLADGS